MTSNPYITGDGWFDPDEHKERVASLREQIKELYEERSVLEGKLGGTYDPERKVLEPDDDTVTAYALTRGVKINGVKTLNKQLNWDLVAAFLVASAYAWQGLVAADGDLTQLAGYLTLIVFYLGITAYISKIWADVGQEHVNLSPDAGRPLSIKTVATTGALMCVDFAIAFNAQQNAFLSRSFGLETAPIIEIILVAAGSSVFQLLAATIGYHLGMSRVMEDSWRTDAKERLQAIYEELVRVVTKLEMFQAELYRVIRSPIRR
jgi:hypothetical protein